MSETELAHRFIASQAKVSSDELRKGRVKADRWPKVLRAVEKLAAAPIFIDDSSDIGVLEMRAKARRLHARHGGLGLIVVDYLQLMRADGRADSRVEQVGQISRGLKILARELDIPVIAVSQLSRAVESRNPPIPMLSDLRESGQLEQDADVVMFVYREEYYDKESERLGEADIIIAKHRNGPIGEVTLTFLPKYPRFASLYRDHGAAPAMPPDATERAEVLRRVHASDEPAACPLRRVRRLHLGPRRGDQRRAAVPLPRAARAPRRQRRHRHRASAGASSRCRSTASRSSRSTATVLRQVRAFARSIGRAPRRGPRAVVRRAGRHRQDLAGHPGRQGGQGRRALLRRLPGAAAAGRDQAHLRPRRQRHLPRLLPPPVHGRPARARRPRRREADRVGARAALLDRQRALAGPALDRRDHEHPGPRPGGPGAACSRRAPATCATPPRRGGWTGATSTTSGASSSGSSRWRARVGRARRGQPTTTRSCACARQIGARTVSRLVEICDDPIPIMGADLRMAAQGA